MVNHQPKPKAPVWPSVVVVAISAGILLAVFLAGCTPTPNYRCIAGTMHVQWGQEAWAQVDGRHFLGRPPGPIKCEAQP